MNGPNAKSLRGLALASYNSYAMMRVDEELEWWRKKWWLEEQYTRVYKGKASPAEVDKAICRVAEVFDLNWGRRTPRHPIYYWLLSTGLVPLQALYGLGRDLLILDGSLRLTSVIDDLKNPCNYESAMFEVDIAAHLKRCLHSIEFRPRLPNGKESDFVARFEGQQVYVEIKRLQESQTQLALNHLSQSVAFSLSDLTKRSTHSAVKEANYKVEFDTGLVGLLGGDPESDEAVIERIKQRILEEVSERAERNQPIDFVIPSVARVSVWTSGERTAEVTCPAATSQAELKRIVRGHFRDAIEQLHPDHAGMMVLQTPGGLEPDVTQLVLSGLLAQYGPKASHVSAALFFPVFHSFPTTWSRFRPFSVINKGAVIPAQRLRSFADLQPLLKTDVRMLSGE